MRLVISGAVTMLLGGCALSGDDTTFSDSPRILRELRVELRHSTPIFSEPDPVVDGRYRVEIDPNSEQMTAYLVVQSWGGSEARFEFLAQRDTSVAGLEARYLTAAHFGDATATLVLEGVEYVGVIEAFDLETDQLYGIVYGSLVIRFDPRSGEGASVKLDMAFEGYVDSRCIRRTGDGPPASAPLYMTPGEPPFEPGDDDPAACVALFEALRATPDDPNGPPPPYSLDDTPSGGPASTPVAPPPG